MPYFNETLDEYECHPILKQGPCEPNYWLVLDKEQPNHSKCVKNPCACESEFTSEETNSQIHQDEYDESYEFDYEYFLFEEFEGSCQDIHDQGNCPINQQKFPNPFGF